ncbi:MAG TPA: PIN domain-containing protein [Myxococcaceae bacterium]|nr:PIN domain-containing protein [Myxococcaceae bacterium]
MSSAALLCDTSALLDDLVLGAPDHAAFREAIDRARTRYVPGLVLSEVDSFLRDELVVYPRRPDLGHSPT